MKEKRYEPLYPDGRCAVSMGVDARRDRSKDAKFMQLNTVGKDY